MMTAALWCALGLALLALSLSAPLWRGRSGAGRERVRYRLELEPRRSVYVVEVAGRNLVLASSEAGIQLLTELDAESAARLPAETQVAWRQALQLRPQGQQKI